MDRLLRQARLQGERAAMTLAIEAASELLRVPKLVMRYGHQDRITQAACTPEHACSMLAALKCVLAAMRELGCCMATDQVVDLFALCSQIEPSPAHVMAAVASVALGMRQAVMEHMHPGDHESLLKALLSPGRLALQDGDGIQAGLWLARYQLERAMDAPVDGLLARSSLPNDLRAALMAIRASHRLRAAARERQASSTPSKKRSQAGNKAAAPLAAPSSPKAGAVL